MAVGLTAPRSGCSIVGFDKKMINVRGRRSSSVVLQHHRRRGMMMTMALARSNSSGSNHHHHELSPPRKQERVCPTVVEQESDTTTCFRFVECFDDVRASPVWQTSAFHDPASMLKAGTLSGMRTHRREANRAKRFARRLKRKWSG